jgi:hypothetical protein
MDKELTLRERLARRRDPEVWAEYDKACACPSVTQPATLERDRSLQKVDDFLTLLTDEAVVERGAATLAREVELNFVRESRTVQAQFRRQFRAALAGAFGEKLT